MPRTTPFYVCQQVLEMSLSFTPLWLLFLTVTLALTNARKPALLTFSRFRSSLQMRLRSQQMTFMSSPQLFNESDTHWPCIFMFLAVFSVLFREVISGSAWSAGATANAKV